MQDLKLDELKAEFDRWRIQKRRKNERCPQELIEKARLLLKSHSRSELIQELGISSYHFQSKKQEKASPFIKLPQTGSEAVEGGFILEVELASGCKLRFK